MTNQEENVMKQVRNYGIDLLKIFSMVMVCLMHVIIRGGLFSRYEPGTPNFLVAQILLGISFCAVDCFAMATGYVCVVSRHRYSRIVPLWLTVIFYGIVITSLFTIISPSLVTPTIWIWSLLPVMSRTYWYFTAYVVLFFLIPLINKGFSQMKVGESRVMLIALFFLMSVGTMVMKRYDPSSDPFLLTDGCHPFWIVYMYLVGAHIQLFGRGFAHSRLVAFLVFILCTTVMVLTGWFMAESPLYKYTSPTVVLQAASVLVLFAHTNFSPGRIAAGLIWILSTLSFSVYIFQLHPLIWDELLKDRFASCVDFGPLQTVFFCLGMSVLIFFGGCAFDLPRYALFRVLRVRELAEALLDAKKR